MLEYLLLIDMQDTLEKKGFLLNEFDFIIDENSFNEFNTRQSTNYTLEEFQKAVNICLTNRWISQSYIADDDRFKLTTTGSGVAKSKRSSNQLEAKKTPLKRAAEKLEDSVIPYWVNLIWGVGGAIVGFIAGRIS
ncbi:hypothetical protein HGT70_14415 [Rosenbergiella collisarenosi]|uniref:hypothetical protein n=1 Tax=Rosenbergiella collisarenosi TaxID=1544695 RepID=UPI001BDA6996|nr:hypothetical protein [Rosenbergiella collisarenosi]MBT0722468.1 hypothetical protein [Rosenbergiella collisarenosi]